MLTAEEPDVDFTLALGADTFIDLARGKWKRTEDVFKLVGHRMVVFRRRRNRLREDRESAADAATATASASASMMAAEEIEHDNEALLQDLIARWQILDPSTKVSSIQVVCIPVLTNVSSSAVRRSTDANVLKEMVTENVLNYILDHNMYAFSELGEER